MTVREYSTRGGTVGYTRRAMRPSRSSPRSVTASMRWLIPSTPRRISLNRWTPSPSRPMTRLFWTSSPSRERETCSALLCAIAGLLDGASPIGGILNGIAALLNRLLAIHG